MREDWIECKLEECSLVLNNLRKPINSSERQNRIANKKIEDLFPYYGATGQVGYIDDYLTDGEFVLLGEDAAPFLEPTKDVAYLIQGKTWVNNHAHILSSLINNKFLLHYLNQFNYKDYVSGTTRLKLTQGSLKSIPVKLAPIPEQRAIVKKLESLFSSLDAGVADLKKAQQQLKIYRQAVLKKAFEGEFEEVKFKELGDAIDPQPSHRTPPVDTNGIPYVSIKDIVGNKLELSKARLVSKNVLQEHLNRYTILENDFIIGKIGTIGNPVKVHLPQNYTLSANVVLIQPRKINPNYLYYYFKSSNIEQQFNSGKKATTQAAFGIQKVRDLIIRYPLDDSQQRKIVLDIETKLSVCDSIEKNIKESLEKAEALRQSILKRTFEGNLLTAQELVECKLAEDYEPASVLLERINGENKKK